jgi:hypothetical protein
MLLLIWLLLLSPAQAQMAIERLCFVSDAEALRARPLVEVVLVKGQDRVEVDGRCLNVTCDVKRSEILNRWVKTRLPQAESTFSSLDIHELECDMLALKKTRKQKEQSSIQVGGRSFQVSAGDAQTEQSEEHILKVTSGGTATLVMGPNELKITCTASTSGTYRLKFSQRYISPPPVIVGGVLVQPSQQENAASIVSELEARRNTPINIGKISKDLSSKEKSAEVPSGVELENTTGNETVEWSLTIR